jgi:hypothetical protein
MSLSTSFLLLQSGSICTIRQLFGTEPTHARACVARTNDDGADGVGTAAPGPVPSW